MRIVTCTFYGMVKKNSHTKKKKTTKNKHSMHARFRKPAFGHIAGKGTVAKVTADVLKIVICDGNLSGDELYVYPVFDACRMSAAFIPTKTDFAILIVPDFINISNALS